MLTVWVRFYEELNDFLPPGGRKHAFARELPEETSVSQLLAELGVPISQVDLVLAGDVPVDFSHIVRDRERISVYPVFETFDIAGLTKVRGEPLRRPRFIADRTVGRLAVYLRMLGFDTPVTGGSNTDLPPDMQATRSFEGKSMLCPPITIRQAERERRILLTRNESLLREPAISRVCLVKGLKPREQLNEILSRLDLYRSARPFRRCPACNHPFAEISNPPSSTPSEGNAALDEAGLWIGDKIHNPQSAIRDCDGCGRACREGPHLRRMCWFIGWMLRAGGSRQSANVIH